MAIREVKDRFQIEGKYMEIISSIDDKLPIATALDAYQLGHPVVVQLHSGHYFPILERLQIAERPVAIHANVREPLYAIFTGGKARFEYTNLD